MTRRFALHTFFSIGLWLALGYSSAALAQEAKQVVPPAVAAAASSEQARFLADAQVARIRLEVLTLDETRLYDSELRAGNLLEWNWRDQQGQALPDGTYRCVITVQDLAGQGYQRQGVLLIENGTASWQAPIQAEAALRNTAAFATAERLAWFATVNNQSELAAAVLAHDGKDARLMTGNGGLSIRTGNFLNGNEQEQLRLTPDGKLDIVGLIRTGAGFVFPDGTVQKTAYVASGQALKQLSEDGKPVKLAPNAPAVGGSGTPNRLMMWAANGVDATTSAATVIDNGPGGGITVNGGVASTFFEFSASGTFLSFKPAISNSALLLRSASLSGNLWIGHLGNVGLGISDPASRFATGGNATVGGSYYNTAAPANGLLVEGNVGIGTNAPGSGHRLHVINSSGNAIFGETSSLATAGVKGNATVANSYGVWGTTNALNGYGVYGYAGGMDGFGVFGQATGAGYGVVGANSDLVNGTAGQFNGHVNVSNTLTVVTNGLLRVDSIRPNVGSSAITLTGNLNAVGNLSKTTGSFKIDHPLDPANKYLYHSFVESPDMMNIYNGNVKTDEQGLAVITLPDYFEALNREFRYQLTVIGQFAQAIVAEEITGNQFTIQTNQPNVKVSWQVTGVRQDAYAEAHRIPNTELKPEAERGSYLHPEVQGQPEEKGIEWARQPEMMKRLKEQREKAQKEKPSN